MSERKYTVVDVDALRCACELRWLRGTTNLGSGIFCSRAYKERDKDCGVEEMVRTYMIAGVTAEQIYEADA